MQVTDFQWFDEVIDKNGGPSWICDQKWNSNYGQKVNRVGYYMDEYLGQNLMSIPNYLKNAWDVVGIVSGHGKVRIGKSSIAQQVGLYLAWLIAGGRMEERSDWLPGEPNKFVVARKPQRVVKFDLKENIVFSPEQLMNKASELYKKYGKHQVIIYDEGRAGLDSAKAMTAINKAMQDFFQECGMYGHVILIVLPSFFKLHEDYATSRSLFLIDVYANKDLRRGFFNFYNEQQKEFLYLQGRKKVGTLGKYQAGYSSFSGRFTKFLPFDKDEYEAEKMKALGKKTIKKRDQKFINERNHYLWAMYKGFNLSASAFADYLKTIFPDGIGQRTITDNVNAEDEKLRDVFGNKRYRKILRNLQRVKRRSDYPHGANIKEEDIIESLD